MQSAFGFSEILEDVPVPLLQAEGSLQKSNVSFSSQHPPELLLPEIKKPLLFLKSEVALD